MDGMLSQEEINALLNGIDNDSSTETPQAGAGNAKSETVVATGNTLTEAEKDVVGEISNISMGSAATALFSLLNQRVNITTPKVTYATWDDLMKSHEAPCVFVQIYYKDGIEGNNIFILQEKDVKIIADLMMGGNGTITDAPLSDMHLSAISEAMNQMMGSAATSLSSILDTRIDISPPISSLVDLTESINGGDIAEFLKGEFVKVSFQLEVGDLINSELMQLYPFDFAKILHEKFMKYAGLEGMEEFGELLPEEPVQKEQLDGGLQQPTTPLIQQGVQQVIPQVQPGQLGMPGQPGMPGQAGMPGMPGMPGMQMTQPQSAVPYMMPPMQDVNIAPVQFQPFMIPPSPLLQTENIDLLLDVPLEVTAELGRTSKSIKEILDFSPGTIIELNRLAGEPIDVMVNGKYVAKGEVVVIEETFGIRVTDIIK